MNQPSQRREDRKAQTRLKLIRSAQKLFMENGYEATTLEGVANGAGLHVQTLYRHFSSKIELAAAGDQERLDDFKVALGNKPKNISTFQFWKGYVSAAAKEVTARDDGSRYRELLHEELRSPCITNQLKRLGLVYRELLMASLEAELRIEDPVERKEAARILAITMWGAHEDMMLRYGNEGGFDLNVEIVAQMSRVQNFCQTLFK